MSETILRALDVKGYYKGVFGIIKAVDGVTISLRKEERLGIAGESGCGKSTFAKIITATRAPHLFYEGGKVEIEGYDIWRIPAEKLRKEVRCKLLSYIPQASLSCLNPTLRIKEFIADMLEERTGHKYSSEEAREMVADHFERLNLDERVIDLYPHELSGGMKQRVIIAISTYANPSLLIADEPTSSLDVSSQRRVIEMLLDIYRKRIIKSLICIGHDLSVLRQLCDRLAIMYAGKLVEVGEMDDMVNEPLHPYTKMLLKSLLPLERRIKYEKIKSIPGRPPDLRNPPLGCRFYPRCPKRMEICRDTYPPLIKVDDRHVWCWLYS